MIDQDLAAQLSCNSVSIVSQRCLLSGCLVALLPPPPPPPPQHTRDESVICAKIGFAAEKRQGIRSHRAHFHDFMLDMNQSLHKVRKEAAMNMLVA